MDIDSCFQAGYVIKRHGLKGAVKVHLDFPLPSSLESVFVKMDNQLVPFFIQAISVHADKAILKLEDINTPEEADQIVKSPLYLPDSLRPKPASNDFGKVLVGFTIMCGKENLGTVESLTNHALNPLLVVITNGKEVLIPATEHFIKKVNYKTRKIHVELPDGFLEI